MCVYIYTYIHTHIDIYRYSHTLLLRQHTGVLCIGAPALRRDSADCSQVEETGVQQCELSKTMCKLL